MFVSPLLTFPVDTSPDISSAAKPNQPVGRTEPSLTCHLCSLTGPSSGYITCTNYETCRGSFCRACSASSLCNPQSKAEGKDWKCPICVRSCKCVRCQPREEEKKVAATNGEDTETEGTLIISEWRNEPYLAEEPAAYRGPKQYSSSTSSQRPFVASPNSAFAPPNRLPREPVLGKLPPISQFLAAPRDPVRTKPLIRVPPPPFMELGGMLSDPAGLFAGPALCPGMMSGHYGPQQQFMVPYPAMSAMPLAFGLMGLPQGPMFEGLAGRSPTNGGPCQYQPQMGNNNKHQP